MTDGAPVDSKKAAARLLGMVECLHEKGYELIRIMPYLSGMGSWRCTIGAKHDFDREYGIRTISQDNSRYAYYTSADGFFYFGWVDSETLTEEQLADRFLVEFPEIAKDGMGQDAAYMDWFKMILTEARQRNFPYVIAEDFNGMQSGYLGSTADKHLPLPDAK